jgi:hypothetical protein
MDDMTHENFMLVMRYLNATSGSLEKRLLADKIIDKMPDVEPWTWPLKPYLDELKKGKR